MNISTLWNIEVNRHPLFKGDEVQFCISGRASGLTQPVAALQNSVHGSLQLKLGLPGIGDLINRKVCLFFYPYFSLIIIVFLQVDNPFCEINYDGCADLSPPCQPGLALSPGQEFCYCSSLQVPTWSPEVSSQISKIKVIHQWTLRLTEHFE